MTKKKAIYTIDGKPAKLRDVKSSAQDATLKEALGDYISAKDAYKAGVKDTTLRSWRNSGKIRAKKEGGYYAAISLRCFPEESRWHLDLYQASNRPDSNGRAKISPRYDI